MRKIFIVLMMVLLLTSCKKQLKDQLSELGYSEDEILFIEGLDESRQELFKESYNQMYLDIMTDSNYDDSRLDEYTNYYGLLDCDRIIDLVNRNIINLNNKTKLRQLYTNEYYLDRNEALYLKYLDSYDSVRKTIEMVNTNSYKPFYSDTLENDISKNYLMLVNKYYYLPLRYEPDDLVEVSSDYGKGLLRKQAYENFIKLHDDAYELGYNIRVVSPYRSYDYQLGLYQKYLNSDPQEVVDTYSARAGHSEHQTGLCMDVSIPGVSIDDFGMTEASVWLAENCHKYGFIVRFPQGKEDVTGYMWEPWHIRYIGVQDATEVYEKQITFDEYYACYVEGYGN